MSDTTHPTQSAAQLPTQSISEEVLQEKYAKSDEASILAVNQRVARALAQVEAPEQRSHWEGRFLHALQQGFLPAGRIQSAAGTDLTATLINCFVQPVGDSIAHDDDGHPGIYVALMEAAETMRRGGGVGYDFSRIRPRGAWVGSTRSSASGPVSYMRVYDRSCETVESAGSRRGAQMGVLRCDHPDIEEFIHAKDAGDLRNFNISVGVTDAFMQAVQADGEIELVHRAEPGEAQKAAGAYQRPDKGVWVYRKLRARAVGADHALHLRPRRTRRAVPRHHQPRQQPVVLRNDSEYQPLRDGGHMGHDVEWSPAGWRADRPALRCHRRRQAVPLGISRLLHHRNQTGAALAYARRLCAPSDGRPPGAQGDQAHALSDAQRLVRRR